MHSVRRKFLLVIALCLLPMAAATRVFFWAARSEMRDDAIEQVKSARSAFNLELKDDLARLQVSARLISTDPDLARELAARDGKLLYEHIDDFGDVYPELRIFLTDASGVILASSHQNHNGASLAAMPAIGGALAGAPFSGIARFVLTEDGKEVVAPEFSSMLARPISFEGKRVGAVLALFPLDRGYLDNTEEKEGLALALSIGGEVVAANADHPAPQAKLKAGEVELRSLPDGREIALSSFSPPGLGALPGEVTVLAAKDVSEQFHDAQRFLDYRMIVLALIAILALAAGLLIANPIVSAIRKIAAVLPDVARKRYALVEGVKTGDELQALAETYNAMVAHLRESEKLREALGKYLSRAARDAVEQGNLDLGGVTLPATVLFSDIRSFTTLSEKMEPERVLTLLNRYFTEMVGAVVRHRGIVDKFMGDCIMAVWGPPVAQKDDALNAVRAALAMRERLGKLNIELAKEGFAELRTGIGIHSGPVVAGNMGAASTAELEGKMEYTVIGDTVNLASRLESMTKELHCEVLLSEDTYRMIADQLIVEPMPAIQVRGRTAPIGIYKLIGLKQQPKD